MRILSILLPVLVLLWGCATAALPARTDAELPSAQPFEGANVILIDTGEDLEGARESVVRVLRIEDYDLTQRTLNEAVIATEPRTFGSGVPGSARYYFELPEAAGEPIRLYGEYITQQVTDANSFAQFQRSRVSPGGDRRSASWMSWDVMDELAGAFRGATIQYDRD